MKKKYYPLITLCFTFLCLLLEAKSNPAEQFSFISKPSNGSIQNDAPFLKVTANVVTGAMRYTIQLSTTSDFSKPIVVTSTVDNQRTLLFSGLTYNTKYYARAKADVSSSYGKVTSFTTKVEDFPSIISPLNGSGNIDPLVIKLESSLIKWATRYTVEVSKHANFSDIVTSQSSLRDNQNIFVVKELENAVTYYVRVKSNVSTNFGPVTSFITRDLIAEQRLWGINAGGINKYGKIYSFSIDSLKYTSHFDHTPGYSNDVERFNGTMIPAGNGGFYGSSVSIASTGAKGTLFYFNPDTLIQYYENTEVYAGGLLLGSDNFIYATSNDYMRGGSLLRVSGDGFPQKNIHNFQTTDDGIRPYAAVVELNGYLYGTAAFGSTDNAGVIYRIKTDGSGYEILHRFTATTGVNPFAGLTDGKDGYLYGTTLQGGDINGGVVYKIKSDGSDYTVLHSFVSSDGLFPYYEVVVENGVIYGTTSTAGGNGNGSIFKLNTNGNGFLRLHSFNYPAGVFPISLVSDKKGHLYGLTSTGGTNNSGTIFSIQTDGFHYVTLYNFLNGQRPTGGLTLTEDTYGKIPQNIAARTATTSLVATSKFEDVTVYPNPTNSQFNIQLAMEKSSTVMLTDMNGKIVYQSATLNGTHIIGENLSQGVYILKVKRGDKLITKKLIKN